MSTACTALAHRQGDTLFEFVQRLALGCAFRKECAVDGCAVMRSRAPYNDLAAGFHPLQGCPRAQAKLAAHGGRHRDLALGGKFALLLDHGGRGITLPWVMVCRASGAQGFRFAGAQYQSSTSSSGTRANSRRLWVTKMCPCRRAIAAINRSVGPIGVPAVSSWSRILAA